MQDAVTVASSPPSVTPPTPRAGIRVRQVRGCPLMVAGRNGQADERA